MDTKKTVYLDATFPSYMYDKRKKIKTYVEITNKWWKEERNNYKILTSQETIAELEKGDYPIKEKTLKFISQISILSANDRIFKIAQIYIDNYLMPQKLQGDAIHLAYTSFYKVDFLLTWNCNHLANANKMKHIRTINKRLNLMTSEIITPLELFSETKEIIYD